MARTKGAQVQTTGPPTAATRSPPPIQPTPTSATVPHAPSPTPAPTSQSAKPTPTLPKAVAVSPENADEQFTAKVPVAAVRDTVRLTVVLHGTNYVENHFSYEEKRNKKVR